ncbi:hypothetical protein EV356DRAFT_183831 [Viridothelium virens]|uniref:DUF7730 domain-containing protein n=1 Tax=Viridothelium virens TaxID=1048519 RepID=A0A6A6H791_VIRVR|nr:hypothetical protein EV356DRAFT_183831 [Viridothelium virens]
MPPIKHVFLSTSRRFQIPHWNCASERDDLATSQEMTTAKVSSPKSSITFTNLPPELHLMIYRHLLLSPHSIELWPKLPNLAPTNQRYHAQPSRARAALRSTRSLHPSLLRVSRTIHRPAASVLYSENEFRFSDLDGWLALSSFLLGIGPGNWRLLRQVAVHVPLPGVLYQCPKHVFSAEYDDEVELVCRRVEASGLLAPPVRNPTLAFEDCCCVLRKAGGLRTLRLVVPGDFDARDEWAWYRTAFQMRGPPERLTDFVRRRLGTGEVAALGIAEYGEAYIRRYGIRSVLRRLQRGLPELQISLVELDSEEPVDVVRHSAQCRRGLRCHRRKAVQRLAEPPWKSYYSRVHPDGRYDIELDRGRVGDVLGTGQKWCHDVVLG